MTFFHFREPFSAWSHALWLVLSVPATLLLLNRCGRDRGKWWTLLIYGLGMAACYFGSSLYHGVRCPDDRLGLFERLDHVGIHLLIAGSYTPLAWNLLRGPWRWGTLTAVWSTTAIATTLLIANTRLPTPLATCEYLALGWGALLCYFEIARVVSHRAMRPLVVGGIFYSVGAVLNLMDWPVLWSGVVGSHEVFHLWVMAGSSAHYWFMLTAVVPFAYEATQADPSGAEADAGEIPEWSTARTRRSGPSTAPSRATAG